MEYRDFGEQHLTGVLRLTEREGWPSFSADPQRALAVLTAPGIVTVVAVKDDAVVGFARALSDGAITSYLAEMAVAPEYRGRGIGRRLVEEVFQRCGTIRIDLLSVEDAEGFYRTLQHRTFSGYRIYRSPAAEAS